MDTHRKGGKDHLGPTGGAMQRGSHVTNRQEAPHGKAPQGGSHGHQSQTPVTGPGKMPEPSGNC